MSHITKLTLFIEDLDALEQACAEDLGLELVRGQKTHKAYFGNKNRCEHAIRVPGNTQAYEIGLVSKTNGEPGYEMQWDDYAGGHGLVEKVGVGAKKLEQAYKARVAARLYQRKGYRVTVEKKEERLVVRCRK
jgi:hypothetical protein